MGRIEDLLSLNILQPYAEDTKKNTNISDAINFALERDDLVVCIAGRIKTIRKHGKLTFYDIEDSTGIIQIICDANTLGENNYRNVVSIISNNDIVDITGKPTISKTGTPSILMNSYNMIAPCLEILPPELKDTGLRFENRTADIIINKENRKLLETRAKILFSLRAGLNSAGFLETTTPVLNAKYGGGKSQPFTTYYNALNQNMFLRATMDLYLKRMVAGGFDRVYEIGKNFRNEGICSYYTSEFTALEVYAAYMSSSELESIMRNIFNDSLDIVNKNFRFLWNNQNWRELDYKIACKDILKINVDNFEDFAGIKNQCTEKGYSIEQSYNIGDLHSKIAEVILGNKLIEPTILKGLPVSTSPLMKTNKKNRSELDRSWFFINGIMFCDLAGEISDPTEQLQRLEEQKKLLTMHNYDNTDIRHIQALKVGIPCLSGIGMGIDRFILGATKSNHIREVIPFPLQYETIKTR